MSRTIYNKKLKEEAKSRKEFNIEAFSKLDRAGLSHIGTKEKPIIGRERRLLIREFDTGEKLYIQYPGKESIPPKSKKNSAKTRGPRPWDFRPKMLLPNGKWMNDLSFKDVWGDLYNLKNTDVDMSHIAALLFRIAFMVDTTLVKRKLKYEDINEKEEIVESGVLELEWYEYLPEQDVIGDVNIPKNLLRDCSLLSYLSYNDLLAQNEDCKYYYIAEFEKNDTWKQNNGRTNTLLTHMSVIAFMEEKLKFEEMLYQFQKGNGVAPLNDKLCEELIEGKIQK